MSGSPFAPGGGGGPKPSPFAPAHASGGGGVGGLIDNMAADVKNAVIGLPLGLEQTVLHPLDAAKAFGTTTWHTWSPLFHGHVGQFAHGVYDHPLAPLLDVMSVFSLGAGAAAKVASMSTDAARLGEIAAGSAPSTFTEKLAALREPKATDRLDPTGAGRVTSPKQYSTRAGRRLAQEGTHKAFLAAADHLPKWFVDPVKEANFTRAFVSDTAHRHLAAMGQYAFAMKAGETVSGDSAEHVAGRANVLAGMVQTLLTKSPRSAAHAADVGTEYAVVRDPKFMDPLARREVLKAQRKAAYWNTVREKAVAGKTEGAGAHDVTNLRNQLQAANEQLRAMHDKGIVQHGIPEGAPGAAKRAPTAKQLMNAQAAPFKEAEANIARLEKQLAHAREAKSLHNKATAELDQLGQHINAFHERMWGDHFRSHAATYEGFQKYLGNFGKYSTIHGTSKRALAKMEAQGARDANGHLILVPRHTADALGMEGAASSKFVRMLWHNPTKAWKMMQVGYTPRTIVNNGVGNWMLFMMRSDPISGFLGMRDAIRWAKGEHEAMTFNHTAMGLHSHWLTEFKDELGQGGVGGPNVKQVAGGGFALRTGKIARAQQGVYPLVHKWSDEPVRASALASYMRKDRGVAAQAKEFRRQGLAPQAAFDRAVRSRLVKDPHLHDRAVAYSRSISGDYVSMNKLERHVRNVMPFYLWNRHIARSGYNLTMDTPGRVALLQSVSNQGVNKAEQILGPLPDFLKGAIPLSVLGLGGHGSRTNLLSTQGLNPFATIGDLAGTAQAGITGGGLHPGESTLGQLFPVIGAGAEWATKTSLLTGQPIKNPGAPIPFISEQITNQIPEMRVLKSLFAPSSTTTPKGNPTLFTKSATETLSSLLGVPIKQVDQSSANALAAKQGGTKKKKSPFATTQGG